MTFWAARPREASPSDHTARQIWEKPHSSHLEEVIERAAHLLPSQGPINVFIHHNTLHAFEDFSFHEAIQRGACLFGCQVYLTEDRYRQELVRGRIRFADLWDALREDLGQAGEEKILDLCSRLNLRLSMLQYPLRTGPTEELVWYVAETDALRRFRGGVSSALREQMIAETRHWVLRDLRNSGNEEHNRGRRQASCFPAFLRSIFDRLDEATLESWSESEWEEFTLRALWATCCQGVAGTPSFAAAMPLPIRHCDLLRGATGADADVLVHEELIAFCGAFVDQGLARWELPRREEGFLAAFSHLYRRPAGPPECWRSALSGELRRLNEENIAPLESIRESLDILGVAEPEWYDFIAATLLALRGWAGILRQMELRGDRVARPAPKGSLVEYLAVRLLLERAALAETARTALQFTGPLRDLRTELRHRLHSPQSAAVEPRAFVLFQIGQMLGWTPEHLCRLQDHEWRTLIREIEIFPVAERRRIFHRAYERRFSARALDAVSLHAGEPAALPARPRFQAVFCIDEREESLRRHLEERAGDVETESVAGFFHVPMYYRGAADAHFIPLCPVVIHPQHWVVEQGTSDRQEVFHHRARMRRRLGMIAHQFHLATRTFVAGALLTGSLGVLASFPLVARILSPRLTASLRRLFGTLVRTPPRTRLRLERGEPAAGTNENALGFTLEEMAEAAERLLRDIGLTSRFSRLVLLIGHGSESQNNPHNSAYNCGACGGAAGGPNARAMASILNTSDVRERLAERRLFLAAETIFVGGCHNTCTDTIVFFDEDRIPASHREEFAAAQHDLEEACERNAHERCRRFLSAPLSLSAAEARQHVEERSEDLAQPRPECGHATNALCIVGRRQATRGLFLDRRAFLASYDPMQDDTECTILTRVLQAVIPVCAGINLEYYFSYVDNSGWGSGTKLPHNIAALVGVMDGAASDLRTGLPWQMVEIHEPVRLLCIVETTTEAMLSILRRETNIGRLCRHHWIHLAVLDPMTRRLSIYRDGGFHRYEAKITSLPRAVSSPAWYRGWRDHLEFARIEPEPTLGSSGGAASHV